MKKIQIKILMMLLVAAASVTTFSCSDVLDEQPRDVYVPGPDFFETEKGVRSGIVSMYAHLRYIYGLYFYATTEVGTDEYTWSQSADENFKSADYSGEGSLTPSTSRADAVWNAAFPNINTASGVIENGERLGMAASLIAEAKFFRAFDYFLLVQTFGGVPLDLGAGELKYNPEPSRKSARNTVPQVYTKGIFPDLQAAVDNLPDNPRLTGTVTKNVARLFLAKAYLTYAWWLENPKDIPTYPVSDRNDPNGRTARDYYQLAYDLATTAIDNPGPYALQEYYYDVHLGSNDRNSEIMLYADHTEFSAFYNGSALTGMAGGSTPENIAIWFATSNYGNIRSSTSQTAWAAISSVQREAAQPFGRPWTRMGPPIEVFTETFADKVNDSRYDGTFVTTYRGNWNRAGVANTVLYNANFLPVRQDEPILTFLNEEPETAIDYSNSVYNSGVGAGVLPGRADFVVSPQGINRIYYPGLWKLGTYRTDNAGGMGQPNAAITRPFNIAKFSELYLIAAEAAVKGATGSRSAKDLVNVLRARAGKWRWDNNGNAIKVEDHSAEMIAATPATVDLNYVLAERSRELYGEGYRWHDLVRTQTWSEIAKTFSVGGIGATDHTPVTVTRQIQPHHYLQPIPASQIDGLEISEAEKAQYQNPGY